MTLKFKNKLRLFASIAFLLKNIYLSALLIIASLLTLAFIGCPLYTLAAFKYEMEGGDETSTELGGDPVEIFSDALQITLAWDPSPSAVDSYKIIFRVHGTEEWFVLNQISAVPEPEIIVNHADLGNGMFDFGVIAVDSESRESAIHISLDVTADPDTGWYLTWER